MSEYERYQPSSAGRSVAEIADDIEQGATRASHAVRDAVADGAKEIEDAVRPTFRERLIDGFKAAVDDPSQTGRLTGEIVRDHPMASVATIAFASMALGRLLRR